MSHVGIPTLFRSSQPDLLVSYGNFDLISEFPVSLGGFAFGFRFYFLIAGLPKRFLVGISSLLRNLRPF